jgi:hypothetical protein
VVLSELPIGGAVTVYEAPPAVSVSTGMVTTISDSYEIVDRQVIPASAKEEKYTVAKPPELQPLPEMKLAPLVPMFPTTEPEQTEPVKVTTKTTVKTPTILGQVSSSINQLEELLKTPPQHPQGLVETGLVDEKLVDEPQVAIPTLEDPVVEAAKTVPPVAAARADQWAYGVLLIATVVTTIGLIYTTFIAYDYRQRWTQALTTQNARFSGTLDETEDLYGTMSYSESFGFS